MPDRPLRVLALASHPVQYAVPIYRRMAVHPALDFQVAYCTLRGAEAAYDPEFAATVKWDVPLLDGYSWTHIPNKGNGRESFFGLYNPGLYRFIRDGRFDAILNYVGYPTSTFWIARLAAALSRTAFLFGTDAQSMQPRDAGWWKARLKKIAWPLLFRLAHQVIVPSTGTRDLMLSLGIPPGSVTLTPYVVDNDWWTQQSAQVGRDAVRTAWGAGPTDTIFLFCAKLQPWKRPLDVLRAFARAKLSGAFLIFAGEGPWKPRLQAEAESLGVAPSVRFLGFVNQTQLPSVYTASDLLVLPSEYEPFAVVVNEAMLCGCPVAVSDKVGAGRDLVAPVDPSRIFPCGDIDALVEILRCARSQQPHRSQLGCAVREHIRSWSPAENISAVISAVESSIRHVRRD